MPPQHENQATPEVLAFRTGALSLQRSFAVLSPIIRRTYLLSANAEVTSAHLGGAGASFGIIARELVYVVRELSKLIDELDQLFRQVARSSAGWLRAERRAHSLRAALARLERQQRAAAQPPAAQGSDAALDRAGEPGPAADIALGGTDRVLSEALTQSQDQVLRDLGRIVGLMRRTTSFVNRLSWVAVRQCHFVAVTARIEAARANSAGEDIASVAQEIRRLADDIAVAEQAARDGVLAVMSRIEAVTGVYGAGVARAAVTEDAA